MKGQPKCNLDLLSTEVLEIQIRVYMDEFIFNDTSSKYLSSLGKTNSMKAKYQFNFFLER